MYLMQYSLGWASPAHGLHWWLTSGRPVDDDLRLQMLRDIWWNDGQLEWLAAWLFPQADLIDDKGPFTRRWRIDLEQRGRDLGIHNPLSGSGSPLHLKASGGDHCDGPERRNNNTVKFITTDPHRRTAALITDSMIGWYQSLESSARTLPDLGDRSWHVDVIVKPVGWLGTYRQSRSTGRWFSGKHRYHSPGNVTAHL